MTRLLLSMLVAFSLAAHAEQDVDAEVAHLLVFVADSGCTFVRNGTEHSSQDAAEHLQMKFKRGRRYVDSAEDFINRLASESSWSGKPYTVQCGDSVEASGVWLHRELAAYRQSDSITTQATAGP